MKSSIKVAGLIIFSIILSACRAEMAPDTGFVTDPDRMQEEDTSPLDAVWFAPGFSPLNYQSITVAAVDTTHLLKMSWWDQFSLAESSSDVAPEKEILKWPSTCVTRL